MNKIPAFCLFTLLLSLVASSAYTQKRPLEKEVLVEKFFIDAMREKILGNTEDAAYLFGQVIQKDRNNHAAYFELAQLYENHLSRRQDALQKARKAVELNPVNIYYTSFYAKVLSKEGDARKAAAAYEDLVRHHPNKDKLYHQWAEYLIEAGKPELAIKVYNNWEKEGGEREAVYEYRFKIYRDMGKRNKAESEMEALLEAHPNHLAYLKDLAKFYQNWKKEDKALGIFRRILEIDPNDAVANIAVADIYKAQGDDLKYLKALRGLFNDPEQSMAAKINVLVPYLNQLAREDAPDLEPILNELADILAEQHPNEGRAQVVQAEMLFYTEQYKRALRKFEETLELEKSQFAIWEKAMLLADKLEARKRLVALSNEAAELYPNQAAPYYFQARAAILIEQAQPALQYLAEAEKRAFGQRELNAKIQAVKGQAKQLLLRYHEADEAFEKALELSPNDKDIQYSYGIALIQRTEQLPKAQQLIDALLKAQPQSAKYNAAKGRALYKQKEYTEARAWYEKALRFSDKASAPILEQYGDVLYRLGEKENAVEYWQKAQEAGAESALLERKIATKKLYE